MQQRYRKIAGRRRRSRCHLAAYCLSIALPLLYGSYALGQTANQNFLVGVALDNKISIQATDASLKDVLLELQARTGIPVNFAADMNQRVSVDITEQDIEFVIAKLTPNHMIIRDKLNGIETISEIIIISDDPAIASGGDGSSFLPSGQPTPAMAEDEINDPVATTANDDTQIQADTGTPINQPVPIPKN